MNNSQALLSTDQIIENIKAKGIAHLYTDEKSLKGTNISLNNVEKVNFGSCSYLGLEFEPSLVEEAKKALDSFGTQFSSSRAYLSLSLYEVLESKLKKIFGNPVVVTPTTTLGHMSAIPVLVGSKDLIILDHQVHTSVQTAAKIPKSQGTCVEMVRHNRMDLLEEKIVAAYDNVDAIWYMADGIYSMFGDFAPIDELYDLLNKYEKFHLYVDDAHGMSCYGESGRGYVLADRVQHDKMVVATSFAKAFATGGGALVFPNQKMADRVRNCGGPMITSGPMQPSAIGAAIASADIHLSSKIYEYQEELRENIRYCHLLLEKHGLPNLAEKDSPIFFVGVGLPKIGYSLVSKMIQSGFLVNIGIFPAVPMKNTGVRFTITRLHTFTQIEEMVGNLASFFYDTLKENDYSLTDIYKAFKIDSPVDHSIEQEIESIIKEEELTVEIFESIIDIDKNEWNHYLGRNGAIDWHGLNVLESSFNGNPLPEENWDFNYLIIRDSNKKPVLMTFFTSGIMKDDMLSDKDISASIELKRAEEPYFYTSRFLSLGTLLTEGCHLFIDKNHKYHSAALAKFFETIDSLQTISSADTLIIRDMRADDTVMDDLMVDNGFFKLDMPENYSLDISKWESNTEYLEILSKRSKKHFKQNVRRFISDFVVDTPEQLTKHEIQELYDLYLNVQGKGLDINTHKLPFKLFEEMAKSAHWDIIRLKLKKNKTTVGVVFAYKGRQNFVGGMVGIDYRYAREHGVYRQAIYQFIVRARELGYSQLDFGFCAGIEKKKFGATAHSSCAYMQVRDNYVFEAMSTDSKGKELTYARN